MDLKTLELTLNRKLNLTVGGCVEVSFEKGTKIQLSENVRDAVLEFKKQMDRFCHESSIIFEKYKEIFGDYK
jgi:hypothetical protein